MLSKGYLWNKYVGKVLFLSVSKKSEIENFMKEYRKVRKTYQGKILGLGFTVSWVTKRGAFEPKIDSKLYL